MPENTPTTEDTAERIGNLPPSHPDRILDGLRRGAVYNGFCVDADGARVLLDQLQAADYARAERDRLAAIRERRVDPDLLRWCDWPQCLANFNVADGPPGPPGLGWVRGGSPMVLLCPAHSSRGHTPHLDWDPEQPEKATARCSCGAHAEVKSSLGAARDWWTGHVAALDTTQDGDIHG